VTFTSPHLGSDFGELLAEQFVRCGRILERPVPFTLFEMGAGQGLPAADILGYLYRQYQDFLKRWSTLSLRRSALRKEQQWLQKFICTTAGDFLLSLRWVTLEEIQLAQSLAAVFQ